MQVGGGGDVAKEGAQQEQAVRGEGGLGGSDEDYLPSEGWASGDAV